MSAPKDDAESDAPQVARLRQRQVGCYQQGNAAQQHGSRIGPVAKDACRVGEQHVGEAEQRERERRPLYGQPDVDCLQDQEAFGKAGEAEQEADQDQTPHLDVQIAPAAPFRCLPCRSVSAGLAKHRPGEEEG